MVTDSHAALKIQTQLSKEFQTYEWTNFAGDTYLTALAAARLWCTGRVGAVSLEGCRSARRDPWSAKRGVRMLRHGTAVYIALLIVLVAPVAVFGRGNSRAAQTEAALKDLLHAWRKGGGWQPYRERPAAVRARDQQIHSAVKNIVGGLKTLGLLPRGDSSQPELDKALDRNRLSGFLYNISMYLQGVGEAKDNPHPSDQDQFWENVLYSFLQLNKEGLYSTWDGKVAPRPTFKMLDLFLSLRGSPHWDGLLGLVQAIASLSGQQNQRPLLTFFSQNWRMISALLDATLQGLLSGTYGQASAGVQGFICILKGRDDCAFNVGWLQQLTDFLETRNWKPVINLHPAILAGEHHTGSPSAGRFKPFSMLPEAFREDSHPINQTRPNSEDLGSMSSLLLQALSRSSPAEPASRLAEPNPVLLKGLDGLRRGLLHRVGSSVYGNLRKKVSHVTDALLDEVSSLVGVPHPNQHGKCSVGDLRQLILWGIRNNLTWNVQALGFSSQGPPTRPQFRSCPSFQEDGRSSRPLRPAQRPRSIKPHPSKSAGSKRRGSEYLSSAEILEAACNDSIPGLTGVSNFTVFLYCNLFDGNDDGTVAEAGHVGPDLHASCSDAAWYLSAAEEDFFWVHVCSEFFAREFNNTVCANASFWLQRAQQASLTQDYQYLNRTGIDELCVQLSSKTSGGSGPDPDDECLTQLRTRSLSARDFRRCFLPNSSTLVASLCGNDSEPYPHESGWAADYCSRVLHNDSSGPLGQEPCDYEHWGGEHFTNHTLLQLCAGTEGLKEHICLNATLLHPLAAAQPWVLGWCSDLGLEPAGGGEKCFLQRVFDMLPAPYNFDTSRLCASPAPFLLEALYSLSQCEGGRDERVGWLGAVRYVLRVLDFVVGISAGLEEGESDVRQGLSQAILLSSLLDNTSFWGTLRPNASLSVLHTIGLFLRKEQDPSLKEDLLSCFSPVLWDLIQREDNSSALRVLFQEYLQMPRESIRTLVMTAEKEAVKRFLSHMRQSWDQLQVETAQASQKEQQAMETMTSAFIHKFTRVTPDLFVDLSQFIPFMSVSDIMTFPTSLMVNDSVLMAIRDHSSEMKSPQKRAFVKRLLQTKVVEEVPSWPAYFLSSILPLLPYVPVCYFQRLTVQQLSPLVEDLGNSSLDATRGRHVLRTVFSKSKNLTCVDVSRLGTLACYLNPEELHQLLMVSPPLWRQLATCVSEGHASSTGRLAHWLALAVRHLDASSLSPPELSALRGLLPRLGASFLQPFPAPRLLQILSQPGLPSYPPAQAFRILTKLTQEVNLRLGELCRLQPLLKGLSPSVLRALSGPTLGEPSPCRCWNTLLSRLPTPTQRAVLHSILQEALEKISGNTSLRLQCLLPYVPLKMLASALDGPAVLRSIATYRHLPWSPQQAQLLFKKILQTTNITRESLRALGRIASGMSCDWFRLWANESGFLELLFLVTELPGGMTPSLRKCVVEELLKRPRSDLNILPPSFSAGLPVQLLESLSNASFMAVLEHIRRDIGGFLRLPRHKQAALAERAVAILAISQEEDVSGAALDLLGPLMPFLDRDTFGQVEREALRLRLDEMKGYCLPQDTMKEMARILTQRDLLGDPATWTIEEVEHTGRLLFALSPSQIASIPLDVLRPDVVEQVLESQKSWEDSEVGQSCKPLGELVEKRENLVRGIVRRRGRRRKEPVPGCADIKGTFPSAWTAAQLGRMEEEELANCVEDLAQDDSLSPEQRRALWALLRQSYGPAKSLTRERILELGCLVTEMNERELQDTNLADLGTVIHLGAWRGWTPKKVRAAMMSFLRHSDLKLEELEATELASLGNLLCGLSPTEISRLDPKHLSMATLFLRDLRLPCSEQQMEALLSQLSRPQGFGPISSWGPEIFTEIGNLAVGLPDMVLSALVREQVEGLTPEVIALIPPTKMAVALSSPQLSWLTVEQASAVTEEQWSELGGEQKRALAMALYEGDLPLEHRGRNLAPLARSPDCLTLWLLCLSYLLKNALLLP
ncbi:stereocilin isoform X2 [Brienomyrus brachyistius]|uniref:stereocilin isoform X2 n=1 Tax=Brienomyrus brachyistius TaxID=42636 RepID=UPI0020B43D2A|nr:stereocilin isoform X2 [Brienomyrus brachyistius]